MQTEVVKRYKNRKLYSVKSNSYVTAQDVALRLLNGEKISIIDNVSGEDLTDAIVGRTVITMLDREDIAKANVFLLNLLSAKASKQSIKDVVGGTSGTND